MPLRRRSHRIKMYSGIALMTPLPQETSHQVMPKSDFTFTTVTNTFPGAIPVIREALLKSHAKGSTTRAALCYDGMVHVSTDPWDRGWGCGYVYFIRFPSHSLILLSRYRNFLMACTALADQHICPEYFSVLDHPIPPGVRNLQLWLEDAWKRGTFVLTSGIFCGI